MITADTIKVDDDEGRYVLVVETDDGATLRIDIHHSVLDFYAQVQKHIRPYVLEADSARGHYVVKDQLVPVEAAYDLDDPKHPTFYERMVD